MAKLTTKTIVKIVGDTAEITVENDEDGNHLTIRQAEDFITASWEDWNALVSAVGVIQAAGQ